MKHRYYLTVAPDPKHPSRVIAVVTQGHPQRGDDEVTVCTLKTFPAATSSMVIGEWYEEQLRSKPWETRQ